MLLPAGIRARLATTGGRSRGARPLEGVDRPIPGPSRRRAGGQRVGAALVLAAISGIYCQPARTQTVSGASPPPPEIREAALPGSGERYTLAVPSGQTPDRPAPLVLSLHFGGYSGPYYGRGLLQSVVEPALRSLGAFVVAPDCPAGAWADPACERAVLAILDDLTLRLPIDPGRVVVTGYSMGGIGTWELAARHPDRFSAAIVMAGRPAARMAELDWTVPLSVIQAGDDEVFPLEPTEQVLDVLRRRGIAVEMTLLDGVTHYETTRFVEPLADRVRWLEAIWAQRR